MKDESDRLGLPAFKILGASWAIERALRERARTVDMLDRRQRRQPRARRGPRRRAGVASRCRVFLPASARRRHAAAAIESARAPRSWSSTARTRTPCRWRAEAAEHPWASAGDRRRWRRSAPRAWVIDGYATLFAEVAAHGTVRRPRSCPIGVGSLGGRRGTVRRGTRARSVIGRRARRRRLPDRVARGRRRRRASRRPARPWPASTARRSPPRLGRRSATASTGRSPVTDAEARRGGARARRRRLRDRRVRRRASPRSRALVTDDECAALCGGVGLGERSRVLLVATEGPTRAGISSSRSVLVARAHGDEPATGRADVSSAEEPVEAAGQADPAVDGSDREQRPGRRTAPGCRPRRDGARGARRAPAKTTSVETT